MQSIFLRFTLKSISCIATLMLSFTVFSQEKFPSKPITFIVPIEAGSDGDVLGRAVMDRVSRILGQPVIVLNRPGAGSSIGYRELHQSKADGYTLGLASATIITNKLQGVSNLDHHNFTQFGAVATFFPILIGSNKSTIKFSTAQEAIAFAKANPGKVNLATAGVGQSWWVGAQTFLSGTNLSMASIPVTGAGANVALLVAGGHAEVGVAGLASARALLEGGQVRFLASLSENRAPPPYDKFPTVKELGYPVSWESTNIVMGPPNIPKEIVAKIASALEQASKDPEFMKFAQERDARPDYIAPDKILSTMDQRREVVKEIMAKAGLLKEAN
ncbi:MAG: tripartite tricarboxylate transporter substrate binding protein [Betaproteobacteria bacterium]|jgi:tripartite-type tricarboxylate transporter receptor subunit TctC